MLCQISGRFTVDAKLQFRRLICTVVQNCCKGRSKKYRKWHFWGCSLSTRQWIDIKCDRNDYVGDGSQYAKWHINRFRGVISKKGWNVNGLCFFIILFFIFCSFFSAAGVKSLDRFWWVISGWVAFLLVLEKWRQNFRGQKFKKPPNIGTNRRFPAKMPVS